MNLPKRLSYYIVPLIVAFFNILIIISPNLVIVSAQDGLLLWFNKVLPAIFPFLIGTNLLIHLGFIDFLGTLLESFMRKIFNVSGSGAFALILGMFSGYPVGAKITASLREENKISKSEAQRLISFTNNSGPLFILGTIGIGMFSNLKIGYVILIIHYLSALTVGIIFRFYKQNEDIYKNNPHFSIKSAFLNLKIARLKTNKSFGDILSISVKNSLETITTIGGFIILFSVISGLFKASQIFKYIGQIILPASLLTFCDGIFMGFIEITNGINSLSENPTATAVVLTTGLVSFSGLSIFAQTVSMINKSDISIGIYFLSKVLHAVFAIIYSILSLPIINSCLKETSTEVFNNIPALSFSSSSLWFLIAVIILLLLCSISIIFKSIKNKCFKN